MTQPQAILMSSMGGLQMSTLSALKAHSIVYVNEIAYYLRNWVEWTCPAELDTGEGVLPAVVFDVDPKSITADVLEQILHEFDAADDVFQPAFAQGAIFIAQHTQPAEDVIRELPEVVKDFLDAKKSNLVFLAPETPEKLPQGPYFLKGRSLHQAWRLYPDENLAFTTGVMPAGDDKAYKFEPLHAAAYSGLYPVIAVPSRLYRSPSAEKPLNGLRVSIKDIFHLEGIHTTAGSRSYTSLYGPQNQTGELARKMIDMGAIIVGKTKLGAYAGSEVPPEKCIDYFPPWNPRGDGYQGPSGSSSGAGSSVSSYEWLDLALGTDSTGSIRMPAASYGLWSLRATWNSFPMDGILPNVEAFDTLGLLARSPGRIGQLLDTVRALSLDRARSTRSPEPRNVVPGKIIYPTDWFPMKNAGQQTMVEEFLHILQEELGTEVLRMSLEHQWSKTGPEDLRDTTLNDYLSRSIYWPNYYDGFHNWDRFREEFQSARHYPPYASPFMTKRWNLCKNITEEERTRGLDELKTYYSWVREHVLDVETSYNIMLIPLGRPGENYRDVVPQPGGEFQTTAYSPMCFSTVLGLPQLIIPIGQNPYQSRVTERTEYAPIVASLVGPRGSDKMLLEIATAALKRANWPTEIKVGRNTFEVDGGSTTRHVGPGSKI